MEWALFRTHFLKVTQIFLLCCLQKKKADGPTDPQQPAKKQKLPPAPATMATTESADATPKSHDQPDGKSGADKLKAGIEAQGNKVRELKGSGADKVRMYIHMCVQFCCTLTSDLVTPYPQAAIDGEVKKLLDLKAQYKNLTGNANVCICIGWSC